MSTISEELVRQKYEEKFKIETWLQGPVEEPKFLTAESSLILGAPHRGKSRLLMRLLQMFRLVNHRFGRKVTIVDVFGAKNDAESTNHLLNPSARDSTLIVTGDGIEVDGWKEICPISEFSIEKASKYEVVITDRRFFGPKKSAKYKARYYSALATIFTEFQDREDPEGLFILAMREIANVVYSINKAGITREMQEAQEEFRNLHSQRYHSKTACVMDTQRFTDSLAAVRSNVDYVYLKGFGRQPIARELDYLWKPHLFGDDTYHGWRNPRNYMVRNIEKDRFIMLAPRNGVALGWYGDIPWHISKGFSPLKKLNIQISLKPEESEKTEAQLIENDARKGNIAIAANDMHRIIFELKEKGLHELEIAAELNQKGFRTTTGKEWNRTTVSYHLVKRCACVIVRSQFKTSNFTTQQPVQTQ